ncbi:MAG: PD-(D/E)XK nuclease family protein [Candidatus Thermoplasmatota archaeon]|nr:PD-(D/E)XK nuclease family protein [Candidatus Thermoplasmatota archaeon]
MPVRSADPETDEVGRFNRLSASQANTWEDCPRLWYYQNKMRLKFPQTPPLFLGRAVEECVCRVLMESPGLVFPNAPLDVMKNGADNLLPLFDDEVPNDFLEWCESRVNTHWPKIRDEMHEEWSKDARKSGNWHDYDMDVYRDMCVTALRMHMDEVMDCKNTISESELTEWREGKRFSIPAPDGRVKEGSHPLARAGECSLVEAWEIARPWFVDPDAPQFSLNAVHPEHWFQGEYDLVYRHGGRIRIMDLKASRGGGDRSGNYVEQLRIYAMLWSITHEGQIPAALEVWYLGVGVRKEVPIPDAEEIEVLEQKLNDLWHEIKGTEVTIEDCPPIPRALRGFGEGGVKTVDPDDSRCATCDWSALCPNGTGDDDLPSGGAHQPPGDTKEYDLTAFADLVPRVSVFAEVFSVTNVPDKAPNITIEKDGGFAFVRIVAEESEGMLTYSENIQKGDTVRLVDVVPSTNWKGELQLKVDPYARVEKAESSEDGDIGLFDFRARWNIVGRVAYTTFKSGIGKNGKPWARKGLVLLDETSRLTVEGWDNSWPSIYNTLQQGDEVAILNVSLDAWAIDVKANLEKGSTIHVISRAGD